jgi:hypothetical protein
VPPATVVTWVLALMPVSFASRFPVNVVTVLPTWVPLLSPASYTVAMSATAPGMLLVATVSVVDDVSPSESVIVYWN